MPVGKPGVVPTPTAVPGNGNATVRWTAPSSGGSPIRYFVVRGYINGQWRILARPAASARSFIARNLTNGRAYWFSVAAVSARGGGPWSSPVKVIPAGPAAPLCPGAPNTPGGRDPWGGCWPGPHNTGVRTGTALRTYTGPCNVSANNAVIDSMLVRCNLRITGTNVMIRNSRILGTVRTVGNAGSFTIVDSEVIVTAALPSATLIGDHNFTAIRVETSGGNRGIYCDGPCTIRDSWVHGQNIVGDAHASGIRMSQDGTIQHNSISCDGTRTPEGGGCSAGLTGYGDFEPVTNNLIERNLFVPATSTFCAYGGASGDDGSKPYGALSSYIRFIENVFQFGTSGRCGKYGAVAAFDATRPGNVARGNRWSNGAPVAV
jgi:hypothetical protein